MTGERPSRRTVAQLVGRTATFALLALAASPALAASAAPQERRPRIECSLERDSCFTGESIAYFVEVLDVEDPPAPDLSTFADFEVLPAGQRSLNSSSMQVVNGRVFRRETSGTRFGYQLRPKRTGRLTVPAPIVTVGNERLAGEALTLEVLAPESQDFVRLVVDVEPAEVFPLRPITVRLRVFVKRIPGEGAELDPIATLAQLDPMPTPRLDVPWIEPPPGMTAEQDAQTWLSLRRVGVRGRERGGFGINGLQLDRMPLFEDPFAGPRHALFDLEGRPATADDVAALPELAGRASEYFLYRLERTLVPQRSGSYELGPTTFKGRLIDSLQVRRVTLKDVFAVAPPARVTVKDPPLRGRPDAFSGAIGRFVVEASVAPKKAHVGDPMTLTVTVRGAGNLAEIAPPRLAERSGFTSSFKLYDASAETRDDERVFTFGLRPLSSAVKEVPPVPFAWFDPEREEYVTAATDPLPIEVAEATRLAPGDIVSAAPSGPAEPSLSARAGGWFAHDPDPRRLGDQRVAWRLHAALAVAMPIVTIAGVAMLGAWERRRSDPRARRRRAAAGRARERIASARHAARGGEPLAAAATLRDALCGLVADAADLPEAGLTAREAKAALEQATGDAALAAEAGRSLEQWESLRYGGGGLEAGALVRDGAALVERAIAQLARAGRLA